MRIGFCCDHAGFDIKFEVIGHLGSKGFEVEDFGTDSAASMDYPDVAHPLAEALLEGRIELGVAICGIGNGMAIILNKHKGIRAGLAWNREIGVLVKKHNNANVLVVPARFASLETIRETIDAWLEAEFAGGRHQRRIDKIDIV